MSILDVIIPFKQLRPGDDLEPVAEWAKQFEGIAQLQTDVVDVFVDNTDTVEVPHGLQRNTFGAVIIGVKNDFITTGKAFSYAVRIEQSDNKSFLVEFNKDVTGTFRFWVF